MKNMTLDELVSSYIKIRNAKKEAKKVFDNETKRMTEALSVLDGIILSKLEEAGATSFKTPHGTAYSKRRSSASVKDREQFFKWATDTGNEYVMDIKANAPNVRKLLEDGQDIPGVNYSEAIVIGVRSSSS